MLEQASAAVNFVARLAASGAIYCLYKINRFKAQLSRHNPSALPALKQPLRCSLLQKNAKRWLWKLIESFAFTVQTTAKRTGDCVIAALTCPFPSLRFG